MTTPVPPTDDAINIRRWAARAWLEMENAGVLPTPQNFDLWFAHVSGANPELSQQIAALSERQPVIPAAALQDLHARFATPKIDVDEVVERVDAIQQAAQSVVSHVAGNSEQLRQYGNTLSHWSTRLNEDRTLENLLQAVSTLSVETARASERNRALEQQLSAATARVARLKDGMEDLRRAASTDILTGLVNRRIFATRLRRVLTEAKADGSAVCVLMLDVDHFKRINDTYGHPAGDLVLRLIGRLLADNVKGRDTAARYGGEEFAVLLVRADLKAATTVANQIRVALESKQLFKKRASNDPVRITVSVGVAQFRSSETAAPLLERADAALYQAKSLGRNQVCAAQ
jgi:diguanylate cyclase